VAQGYDQIADRHREWALQVRVDERNRYLQVLIDHAQRGMHLLDLGCGTGVPTTRRLAERYRVTGVDISVANAKQAAINVPRAQIICGDMSNIHFPPESFDAISAFYSLIHLPRQEMPQFLSRMTRWLRPNGSAYRCTGAATTAKPTASCCAMPG
jgi:ubiquinone/menaquinone biosynthesis C-methylase UbiE